MSFSVLITTTMKLQIAYIIILTTAHTGSRADDAESVEKMHSLQTVQFDMYNVPIINYTHFKDFIHMLKCLAVKEEKYIDILTKCISKPEILEDIIATSSDFLAKEKAKPEQVDFNRCIKSIVINKDSPGEAKSMLYDCLNRFGIEEYTDNFVDKHYTRREKKEFREFLDCLSATNEANMQEEATDCVQSHPIFVEVVKRFKNPFPRRVYPHIQRKSF